MNKKGQATIIFIILIPLFLVLTAFIVDTGINMYQEKKIKNVTEDIMEVLISDNKYLNVNYENEEEVKEYLLKTATRLYQENDIDTEDLYIDILYNGLEISNVHKYYSFMNSLFNKGNGLRQISVDAIGYYNQDDELIIEYKDGYDEN